MSLPAASSYDELPYEDIAFYHTHPSNLCVVATLCGVAAPRIDRCRVLELGCGTGLNLLAMAQSLPDARFTGIDLSERQIERARDIARIVGCTNVVLQVGDVSKLDASLGEFDYIVAHGLFSWVSPAARAAILSSCKRHLAPNGLAYISYNTYPGWHLRSMVRDIVKFHAPAEEPPLLRVRRARADLEKLVAAVPNGNSLYAQLLKSAAENLRGDSDAYFFHEFLEADNQPFLFEEFARMALGHGLRFVAEARFTTHVAHQHDIRQSLDAVGSDPIRREQMLDFLRNRFFRQSILCHDDVQPPASSARIPFEDLRIAAQVEPITKATGPGTVPQYRVAGRVTIRASTPAIGALLEALQPAWPKPRPVDGIIRDAIDTTAATSAQESVAASVAGQLVGGYAEDLWDLLAFDPPFVAMATSRPVACPLVRWQAREASKVTNRLHRLIELSAAEREAVRRLDGSVTSAQLGADLALDAVEVDRILQRLAEAAVLVA